MMRTAALAALLGAAHAKHLSGPMDDRLSGCIAERCPSFGRALNVPNFGGLGLKGPGGASSFGAFVSPPTNGVSFINSMPYALSAMGYSGKPITYRQVLGGPANVTATVNANFTDQFSCACQKCAAVMEAIFQPVGRPICKAIGYDLPCDAELTACLAANPNAPNISTGSMATKDLVFKPVPTPPMTPSNMMTRSPSICQPEAAFQAYKVGYNLTVSSRRWH